MNLLRRLALKLWNIRRDLLRIMRQRSSRTSLVQVASELSAAQVKEQNRWPWYRLLLYAYLGFGVVRFLFGGYATKTGKGALIAQWDVLMTIALKTKVFNFNTCILGSPLTLFVIYLDYTVYVKRYNSVIHLVYDAVVRNQADFFNLNPAFKPKIRLLAPRASVKEVGRVLSWFTGPPEPKRKIKWAVPVLPYYPYLDEQIRLRSLLVNWGIQLCMVIILIITVLVLFAGGTFYSFFFLLPNVSSLPKYLLGQADLLLICALAFHTIRLTLFLISLLLAVMYNYHHYFKAVYGKLEGAYRAVRSGRAPERRLAQWSVFFLGEHLTGHHHIQSANTLLASPIFFWGALSNFTINLYMITSLYFLDFSLADKTLVYGFLTLQFLLTTAVCYPLIRLANDVNTPGQLYGKIQLLLLSPSYLPLKLKLLANFEVFHSENAFHFTLGSLGKVTNQSLFEFAFLYSGQLLFIFSMFTEQIRERAL